MIDWQKEIADKLTARAEKAEARVAELEKSNEYEIVTSARRESTALARVAELEAEVKDARRHREVAARRVAELESQFVRDTTRLEVSTIRSSKSMMCAACGEETKHPPYCIECDMSGRSREHLATMAAHNPAEAVRFRAIRSNDVPAARPEGLFTFTVAEALCPRCERPIGDSDVHDNLGDGESTVCMLVNDVSCLLAFRHARW